MHLDFPNAPTVGLKYPASPTAGVPTYTWDGEKWSTVGGAIGGRTPVWTDGSAPMTGQLTVLNPPVNPTDATAKAYVDAANAVQLNYTAQSLSAAQQTQARSNIFAAPFDALSYNGMQINGSMDVNQELGVGNGTVVNGSKAMDGWTLWRGGTSATYIAQVATPMFAGFSNCLAVTILTAQPVMTAADFVVFHHLIEGYRIVRLAWGTPNAQPITIGFWTAHTLTGLYTGCVANANNRAYAFSYTQNVSSAPEYKTVTIPGDTSGAWLTDNRIGIMITFAMAAGTTYTAPSLNTWLSGNYNAGVGQVNAVASTSNAFRLTGVVVLPGLEAPSAARSPLIMRPFDQELMLCQRYYEKSFDYAQPPVNGLNATAFYTNQGLSHILSSNDGSSALPFKVRKRAAPTFVQFGNNSGYWAYRPTPSGALTFAPSAWGGTPSETSVVGSQQVVNTAYIMSMGHWVADARL